jgi:hypothetical protein
MRMQVVSATGELLVTVREAAGMSNREDQSYGSLRVDVDQSRRMSEMTIAYYDRTSEAYLDGTRDHDVSQNYTALLNAIENDPPYSILDLGCGPGRDLDGPRGQNFGSARTSRSRHLPRRHQVSRPPSR